MCSVWAITWPRVEDRRGAVAPLLDIGGVGRADQRGAHLLGDGEERGADDLEGDAVWSAPVAAHRALRGLTLPRWGGVGVCSLDRPIRFAGISRVPARRKGPAHAASPGVSDAITGRVLAVTEDIIK